ncbi:MAG: hypothetical protein GX660_20220, partial [Clostridiaceae bacterium]|nr:hypothetical protein [Clostridiaceae bacterium]
MRTATVYADESITCTTINGGNYYINTYCFSYAASGDHSYQLLIYPEDTAPDAYEPNDSVETATNISTDTSVNGTINISTDEDFYVVNVSSTGRLTVVLDNIPWGCDYELIVYDANSQIVAGSWFSGTIPEKASILVDEPGDYYIRVYSYSGSDPSSSYKLTTTISDPDRYEINDRYFSAKEVYVSESALATIDNVRDEDWYIINADEAGVYDFGLQNIPTDNDYDIYLYDSARNYIDSSAYGGNADELISASLDEDRYYIQIVSYIGCSDTHRYIFSFSRENAITIEMHPEREDSSDTVQVPVIISNLPSEGVCALDFIVYFNKNILTYTGYEAGAITNTSDA